MIEKKALCRLTAALTNLGLVVKHYDPSHEATSKQVPPERPQDLLLRFICHAKAYSRTILSPLFLTIVFPQQ